MSRWLASMTCFAVVVSWTTPALAISLVDVIELSGAGVPATVITAMIDADGTVFTLDKKQLLELREAGVPDEVILKMLRTRHEERQAAAESSQGLHLEGDLPSTRAARAGDTPGLVIIGGDRPVDGWRYLRRRGIAPLAPLYVVPWIPAWRSPPGPPKPFLSDADRGFGRFINDGWREPR